MMVTLLAWIAHKLVSSKRPTKYASLASWRAATAELWNLKSVLKSWAISRTKRWKGSLRIKSSVDFWYLLISRRATVPGRYLCGFLTPPVAGALLRAALVASCLRGALPPVDLRAVCFVRAIRGCCLWFGFGLIGELRLIKVSSIIQMVSPDDDLGMDFGLLIEI